MFTENEYICCFGEILWDMLPTGKLPGGAPMNVAAHLQNLKMSSAVISRVGNDALGNELKEFLIEKNCTTQWIQTDDIYATGVVDVTLSANNDATYEIIHPVAWDFIRLSPEIVDLVQGAYAFVYGTLACRDSRSYTTLFGLLTKAKLKVYDVNLRPPHYTEELVELLLKQSDIVKMNEEEADIITAWYGETEKTSEQKMTFLKDKFSLKAVIVTQGANGAMLLDESGFYKREGYKVTVADTVGSGDAFLAGFLKSVYEGKPSGEALNYACALGALVATHHGANPAIREADITGLVQEQTHNTF